MQADKNQMDTDAIMGSLPHELKRIADLRRVGVNLKPEDLQTPEQKAAAAKAASDADFGEWKKKQDYAEGLQRSRPVKGEKTDAAQSEYAAEHNARTSASVDDILTNVNGWTTGYGGLLANLPQTDARKLRGKLDTLRANIAFNELAAMRAASKTGGALGSVAVRELELLQNSLGNLDQLQDSESLKTELGKIKSSVERWTAAAGPQANADPMRPVTSHGGGAAAPKRRSADDLIKQYGGKPQ
jgi:hypothetical protein